MLFALLGPDTLPVGCEGFRLWPAVVHWAIGCLLVRQTISFGFFLVVRRAPPRGSQQALLQMGTTHLCDVLDFGQKIASANVIFAVSRQFSL